MTELLSSLTGSVLASAWARLGRPKAWPDIASGLAHRLLSDASLPVPEALLAPLRPAADVDFRRAPELAAFGYVLGTLGARDDDLHRAWSHGYGRLVGREPFPADRQSFVHSPLEVVGIALGAASCRGVADDQRLWLSDKLARGLREGLLGGGPLAGVAASCAMHALPARGGATPHGIPATPTAGDLDTCDLCLGAALSVLFPDFADAARFGPSLDPAEIEGEILRRALGRTLYVEDEDMAGLYVCLERAVNRLLTRPAIGSDASSRIVALCRRFQVFADTLHRRQRKRRGFEVEDEYDVQDLLHAILRLHFDDVRPEEWTPSYAGRSSRMDFFLPRERTVVEVKMTRANLGQKEVGDELIIDKERYRSFPGADTLVCFVYDPGRRCPNPAALEADLAQAGPLRTAVVVCPRGT